MMLLKVAVESAVFAKRGQGEHDSMTLRLLGDTNCGNEERYEPWHKKQLCANIKLTVSWHLTRNQRTLLQGISSREDDEQRRHSRKVFPAQRHA